MWPGYFMLAESQPNAHISQLGRPSRRETLLGPHLADAASTGAAITNNTWYQAAGNGAETNAATTRRIQLRPPALALLRLSGSKKSDGRDVPQASRGAVYNNTTKRRRRDGPAPPRHTRALALHADMKKLIVKATASALWWICATASKVMEGRQPRAVFVEPGGGRRQQGADRRERRRAGVARLASKGEERRGARGRRRRAAEPGRAARVRLIIEGGASQPLVALLKRPARESEAAARCVWNLAYEPENHCFIIMHRAARGAAARARRRRGRAPARSVLHASASNRDAAAAAGAAPVLAKLLSDPEIEDAGAEARRRCTIGRHGRSSGVAATQYARTVWSLASKSTNDRDETRCDARRSTSQKRCGDDRRQHEVAFLEMFLLRPRGSRMVVPRGSGGSARHERHHGPLSVCTAAAVSIIERGALLAKMGLHVRQP